MIAVLLEMIRCSAASFKERDTLRMSVRLIELMNHAPAQLLIPCHLYPSVRNVVVVNFE